MSQQLQITGGAKVRSLEGVITGSTGVLGSLPINASNGIPQLDVNGKILVSQLPNSVMEYKGTWNAATNTPTLADGTGNQGDVYLCNVAGTVNFGSGPISFVVGDQVIYSGTIWQKASGATGSVTSVAVTESGDALTITGSPITTSGTINIGFAGTSAQYVAGDGSLITFPTVVTQAQNLVTEVYNQTGATLTKGTVVYINGGHGNLPTITKAIATGDSTSAQTYGVVRTDITNNNNGYVTVIGNLDNLDTQAYAAGTQLYLSSTTAGAWTSTKQYAPNHLVYVGIVVRSHPTQGVVEIRIQNGFELDELHNVSAQTPSNNQGIFYNSSTSLWENKSIATALGYTPADDSLVVKLAGAQTITGVKTFSGQPKFDTAIAIKEGTSGTLTGYTCIGANVNQLLVGVVGATHTLTFPTSSSYTYTLPSATGTLALTSDIPSLTGYVTLATSQTITGSKYFTGFTSFNVNTVLFGGGIALNNTTSGGATSGHTVLGANADGLQVNLSGGAYNNLKFANTATGRNYTFPDASGTLALSSDLSSYVPTSRTLTINGTTYDLSANRSWTISAGISGSGTTNYVPKFTSGTAIGNSLIFDNGTNVGIGASSPAAKLDISAAENGNAIALAGWTINKWSGGEIRFGGVNASEWSILSLYTSGSERMRISSAGSVGIGTSSFPSANYKLVVRQGTNRNLAIAEQSSVLSIEAYNDGASANVPLAFYASSYAFNNGAVGMNTSTPSSTSVLTLQESSSLSSALRMTNRNSTQSWSLAVDVAAVDDKYLAFIDNTGSVARMVIGQTGNVGIGTSSPNVPLEVAATTSKIRLNTTTGGGNSALEWYVNTSYIGDIIANSGSGAMTFNMGPSAAWGGYIVFKTDTSERMRITSGGNVLVSTTTSNNAVFKLQVGDGSSDARALFNSNNPYSISVGNGASSLWYIGVNAQTASNGLQFYSNQLGGVVMTINTSGQVGINTTTFDFGEKLCLYSTTSYTLQSKRSGTGSEGHFAFSNANGAVGSIFTNGSATSYNTSSDYRLKQDLKQFNGLNLVSAIKTYDFEWKSDNTRMYGVLAHELKEVLPYAVVGEKDGEQMQGVDYSKIVPVLIKAIQELKAEIDELKNK